MLFKKIFGESQTLANGVEVPRIGLGVWLIPNDATARAVRHAVNIGYRHVDTAQAYENEEGTGEGIKSCGLAREEIFVTSKIRAEHKSYKAAMDSIDESLRKMKTDYLDLVLIHSPQPWDEWRGERRYFAENKEVWRALTDAYKAGKARAIGVANFLRDDLENLMSDCEVRPMVNQILLHIGNTNLPLIDFCREQGIVVEAYSPLAHGLIVTDSKLSAIASKYGVSAAQLCVRYVLQLGTIALPKSEDPAHMLQNASVDFEITPEDMEYLKTVKVLEDYGKFSFFPVFSGK